MSMDLISLGQQELCQVRTILTSDAGNKRRLTLSGNIVHYYEPSKNRSRGRSKSFPQGNAQFHLWVYNRRHCSATRSRIPCNFSSQKRLNARE